jgi:hypothetical protein
VTTSIVRNAAKSTLTLEELGWTLKQDRQCECVGLVDRVVRRLSRKSRRKTRSAGSRTAGSAFHVSEIRCNASRLAPRPTWPPCRPLTLVAEDTTIYHVAPVSRSTLKFES